jgi:DNA-binding CsgD family transcriptional regulator
LARHKAALDLKNRLDELRARIGTLTPRQLEVFALVIRGKTNKEIARALGGTERTIKAYRHMVMEKMQVQSVAELVSLAERAGSIALDSGQPVGRQIGYRALVAVFANDKARHRILRPNCGEPYHRGCFHTVWVIFALWRSP